jgi:Glycosyl transferases group 1
MEASTSDSAAHDVPEDRRKIESSRLVSAEAGSTLLLSMRRLEDLVAYSTTYEFEDVIAELTGADRVEPARAARIEFARRVYKAAFAAIRSMRTARALAPRPSEFRVERDYDLFLAILHNPYELFALSAASGWRKRCRLAACFITEQWQDQRPRYLLELLREFDHVFIATSQAVPLVERIARRPCSYLPQGADALRFCPWPGSPERSIDVCNIGRRSPVTHAALMDLAAGRKLFYYYDTVRSSGDAGKQMTFRVQDPREHRLLYANLLKRSRYFIANKARANEPEVTRGLDEIAGRFFEGAAAGTVMLGIPPESAAYATHFDWEDAVVRIPFDAPRIGDTIAELDSDPDRVERIRRQNVAQSLRRHDWGWRVRAIFDALGLAPTPAMLAREKRLRALADEVEARLR